jgi:hypothetical protein
MLSGFEAIVLTGDEGAEIVRFVKRLWEDAIREGAGPLPDGQEAVLLRVECPALAELDRHVDALATMREGARRLRDLFRDEGEMSPGVAAVVSDIVSMGENDKRG